MEGPIKRFNVKKGYGFVSGSDGSDYFVHHTALGDAHVRDGDKVTFDGVDADRGKQAQNVKLAK